MKVNKISLLKDIMDKNKFSNSCYFTCDLLENKDDYIEFVYSAMKNKKATTKLSCIGKNSSYVQENEKQNYVKTKVSSILKNAEIAMLDFSYGEDNGEIYRLIVDLNNFVMLLMHEENSNIEQVLNDILEQYAKVCRRKKIKIG